MNNIEKVCKVKGEIIIMSTQIMNYSKIIADRAQKIDQRNFSYVEDLNQTIRKLDKKVTTKISIITSAIINTFYNTRTLTENSKETKDAIEMIVRVLSELGIDSDNSELIKSCINYENIQLIEE